MHPIRFLFSVGVLLVVSVAMASAEGAAETIEQDIEDFDTARIETGSVRVEVVPARGRSRIEAYLDQRRELIVDEWGDELTVEVTPAYGAVTPGEYLRLFIDDGTSTEIKVGSGAVRVADVDFRDLAIDSGSGSVSVENGDGRSTVVTGSGRITVSEFDGRKNLDTGSGRIVVRDSDGDIEATSGSGGVRLENVEGALTITASSGAIAGDGIDLTGDSSFRTGSGRIDMTFENDEDDLSFDLDAGSGSVRVGGDRGSDRLVITSGDITVLGRTGSGGQVYSFQ